MPEIRKTGRAKVRRSERELSAEAYDQLIRHARDTRSAAGALPKRKGEVAACIALAILQLSQGSVLIKMGSLAKRLSVDLHTLTRGFESLKYSVPPKEMQVRIRNDAARRLLCAEPSRKIDSIASELGYDNLASFTKFFRKQNGVSPLEYRRLCGKQPPGHNAPFG